jgi:hypothetical protein
MTKQFCDGCYKEIIEENRPSGGDIQTARLGVEVRRGGHDLKLEVLVTTDRIANAGDWCKYCLLDALNTADTRPQTA